MTLTGEEAAEVAEGKSEVEASEEVLAEEVQDQLQPPMRPIPTEPSKMVTVFFFLEMCPVIVAIQTSREKGKACFVFPVRFGIHAFLGFVPGELG